MDRQEEDTGDGDDLMERQDQGDLVKNQRENTAEEGENDNAQHGETFGVQPPAAKDGMDQAQQEEQRGGQFMDDDPGQRGQHGDNETDEKQHVQQFGKFGMGHGNSPYVYLVSRC